MICAIKGKRLIKAQTSISLNYLKERNESTETNGHAKFIKQSVFLTKNKNYGRTNNTKLRENMRKKS